MFSFGIVNSRLHPTASATAAAATEQEEINIRHGTNLTVLITNFIPGALD